MPARTNGDMRGTLVCAGHPTPMLVRASGEIEPVGTARLRAGLDGGREAARGRLRARRRGDSLVLYTDGVTEARTNGALYGSAGLEELLRGAAGEDAAGIAGRVDRAAAHHGTRRDDVAVLVARRGGSA